MMSKLIAKVSKNDSWRKVFLVHNMVAVAHFVVIVSVEGASQSLLKIHK